jgi:hypothetical protein
MSILPFQDGLKKAFAVPGQLPPGCDIRETIFQIYFEWQGEVRLMCLAVCNEKLGGCGHIADEKAWSRKERSYYCPVCGQDRLYFLHDYNLEAVVGPAMVADARGMLDEYHQKHGDASPPMASKHGNVTSRRAIGESGKKLSLVMSRA